MRKLALLLCLAAAPAAALDLNALTDDERAAFNAQIRAYLLENPEILVEAMDVLEDRQAAEQATRDAEAIAANADALFEDPNSWRGGAEDGDITVVEFLDYRCGFCKRAHPEVAALLEADPNVTLVVKEYPILGEASLLASRFAIATLQVAGDDSYKLVSDALMGINGDITEQTLTRLANTLGLDTDAILERMDSDAVTEVIAANHQLAQRMGISGTPSFIMGDQLLRGYAPLARMQAIVEEERSEG
ncbi:DsbA family protein [Aestuariibius sp. 2305UL40-4]|uniref:DsbA family protein n=1 Tax=Aestuariibius violaceus TaxID=3234132 RepID=UPI00345E8F0F